MKRSSMVEPVEEEEEEEEELEPLFDYRRVQPFRVIDIEDDPLDCPPVACMKKLKTAATANVTAAVGKNDKKGDSVVIDCDDQEEDDWWPPSPQVTNDTSVLEEDPTRREVRLKRMELASLAQSAEEVLRTVEEYAKRDFATAESENDGNNPSLQSHGKFSAEQPSKPSEERAKIIISIQDKKNGPMQVKVFMDDMFEKIFKSYANKVKIDLQSLVFFFDGERISPTATPGGLGMENEDMIDVKTQ